MCYKITINPDYHGSDPFNVLAHGDKYILHIHGHAVCTGRTTEALIRAAEDPSFWANKLLMK